MKAESSFGIPPAESEESVELPPLFSQHILFTVTNGLVEHVDTLEAKDSDKAYELYLESCRKKNTKPISRENLRITSTK